MLRGAVIPPFYAGQIGRLAAQRLRAGQLVIPMHFGQPSAGAPVRALSAVRHLIDQDAFGYWESPALRDRLIAHYRSTYGLEVPAERILLTAGASAALIAAYATLFRPGDTIGMFTPGYAAYRNSMGAMGMIPLEVRCSPADGYQPTARMIEQLDPAPAGFILSSPANPTGAMLEPRELEALVGVCRERGIRLISDEIYHGITYGSRAASALEFADDLIVVNSFSKLYRMPGWRLGWMVAPLEWMPRISACVINMFLTPSVPAQHVALAVMDETDDLQRWVDIYASNRKRLAAGLASLGIEGIVPPAGAFYLYADMGRFTRDGLQFCRRLMADTGVGLAPGIDFDPEQGQRYVRFSFAVSPEMIEQAIALLRDWLPNYRDQ